MEYDTRRNSWGNRIWMWWIGDRFSSSVALDPCFSFGSCRVSVLQSSCSICFPLQHAAWCPHSSCSCSWPMMSRKPSLAVCSSKSWSPICTYTCHLRFFAAFLAAVCGAADALPDSLSIKVCSFMLSPCCVFGHELVISHAAFDGHAPSTDISSKSGQDCQDSSGLSHIIKKNPPSGYVKDSKTFCTYIPPLHINTIADEIVMK